MNIKIREVDKIVRNAGGKYDFHSCPYGERKRGLRIRIQVVVPSCGTVMSALQAEAISKMSVAYRGITDKTLKITKMS
jgi:hypothetical protein